jgi:hypothetical protein
MLTMAPFYLMAEKPSKKGQTEHTSTLPGLALKGTLDTKAGMENGSNVHLSKPKRR